MLTRSLKINDKIKNKDIILNKIMPKSILEENIKCFSKCKKIFCVSKLTSKPIYKKDLKGNITEINFDVANIATSLLNTGISYLNPMYCFINKDNLIKIMNKVDVFDLIKGSFLIFRGSLDNSDISIEEIITISNENTFKI